MSVNYNASSADIVNFVDGMLSQGANLSVGFSKTYYIYSADRKALLSLTATKNEYGGTFYSMSCVDKNNRVVTIPKVYWHKRFFKYFDSRYSLKSLVSLHNQGKSPTIENTEFINQYKSNILSYDKGVLCDVINNMVGGDSNGGFCSIDLIQRKFYFFDAERKTYLFDPNMLNHEHTLFEYETPRKQVWGFSGKKYGRSFLPFNTEAKQMFDNVKSALQNQR